MQFISTRFIFICLFSSFSTLVFSQHQGHHQHHDQKVEEVFVDGQKISPYATQLDISEQNQVDAAQALKLMPGANVNSNGAITGIAQYRGMYGDRVAVSIDGNEVLSGGPNAMDAPLSYVSSLTASSLVLDRGITSISKTPESIGGHIAAHLDRGQFAKSERFEFDGFLADRYRSNGSQNSIASRLNLASKAHKFSLLGERDEGDNIETPEGELFPSEMQRQRWDASYALQTKSHTALVYVGKLDTQDAGTPALAMDVRSIETDLAGAQYKTNLRSSIQLGGKINFSDVEHWMDNFQMRNAPTDPMRYRQNFATGEGLLFDVFAGFEFSGTQLKLGLNSKRAEHNSTITNPNAAAFEVINFNAVERNLDSVYAEITGGQTHTWELGVRQNQVSTTAGEVNAAGMMGMMATNSGLLADSFNAADRDLDFNNTDIVAKYRLPTSGVSKIIFEVGSKSRAPSYQELYLWLPLQATGGLADGRSYIGNMALDSERANEINVGFDYTGKKMRFAPQMFYREVKDYIQGTPSSNMTANGLANMMMTGDMMVGPGALQFNNVDAKFVGIDMAWSYIVSEAFLFEGVISVLDSERTDEDDNLYRQSPNNARLAIHYAAGDWHFTVENQLYDGMSDVSEYNGELESAGYGLLNLRVECDPVEQLNLELRIDNALDKTYQDHLAGVNRVAGSDIPQGERIYGAERSVSAGIKYRF
ncbi:MAG: TonB-dependent receptor [Agarilytica sp.]